MLLFPILLQQIVLGKFVGQHLVSCKQYLLEWRGDFGSRHSPECFSP